MCVTLALLDDRECGDMGGARVRGIWSRDTESVEDCRDGSLKAVPTGRSSVPSVSDRSSSGDSARGIPYPLGSVFNMVVRGVASSS